jgi:hypothetical protein
MGYIFEAEIDAIIHAVKVKTVGENDGILLKEILSANIHPAIKAYFKAEVEKMLERERGLERRSKKFTYSLAEVKSLEQQIDLLLIQNYHFSLQEFESLLDESVHFQFNYLCRPQWTLKNFIVGDQRNVPASVVEKRLMYCVDYTYFPELIRRYIVDHGLAELSYGEFTTLVWKIDNEVVAQHSSVELAHMTRALFEFVESGKMIPQAEFEQQTLPVNAAIVFFDDKHLADISRRLELERDQNRMVQITVDRLAEIIESVRSGKNEQIAEQTGPVHDGMEISEEAQKEQETRTERIADGAAENTVPEDGEIRQGAPAAKEDEEEDRFDLSPEPEPKNIEGIFSGEERKRFTKKLFAGDELAYQGAISEIALLKEWTDVAGYLDTLFIANDVDPFCREAVLFTDKLFSYYNSPDS